MYLNPIQVFVFFIANPLSLSFSYKFLWCPLPKKVEQQTDKKNFLFHLYADWALTGTLGEPRSFMPKDSWRLVPSYWTCKVIRKPRDPGVGSEKLRQCPLGRALLDSKIDSHGPLWNGRSRWVFSALPPAKSMRTSLHWGRSFKKTHHVVWLLHLFTVPE